MANTKSSIFNMTPADFAVLFVTVPAVQDALVHLETEVTEYLKSFHGGQNSKLKSTEKHQEALDLAKKYREKIAMVEQSLTVATDPEHISKGEQELHRYKAALVGYMDRVQKKDSAKVFEGKVSSSLHENAANHLENLALELGEWFATGAIGPGSVTYRGKVFTAE